MAEFRSCRLCAQLVAFVLDRHDSERQRPFIIVNISNVSVWCPTRKCSWSVVARDLHFSSREVVVSHCLHLHQYGDDMQLYVALSPTEVSPFDIALHCVSDV